MQIRFLFTSFILVSSVLHAATVQIASDLVNESNNRTEANVFWLRSFGGVSGRLKGKSKVKSQKCARRERSAPLRKRTLRDS